MDKAKSTNFEIDNISLTENSSECEETCSTTSESILSLKSEFKFDITKFYGTAYKYMNLTGKGSEGERTNSIEYNIQMSINEFADKYRGICNIYKVISKRGVNFHIIPYKLANEFIKKLGSNADITERVYNELFEFPLVFDIDIDLKKITLTQSKTEYLEKLKNNLKEKIAHIYTLNLDDDRLKMNVFDSSRKNKWSYHFIFNFNVSMVDLRNVLSLDKIFIEKKFNIL